VRGDAAGANCWRRLPARNLQRLGRPLPDIPLLHFDLTQCLLPGRGVGVAVLLNVLEHIKDDKATIARVRRILRPGGSVIIEGPAGSHLYDSYGRGLMHFRRSDRVALEAKLRTAGLTPIERSHTGFTVFPAFWLTKKLSRLHGRNPDPRPQRRQSDQCASVLSQALMRLEVALRSRRSICPSGCVDW
jgi:hypothetical protein